MIRVAGLNKNDVVNGEGISVSLFLQGCPIHCAQCHNPETWNEEGGIEYQENSLTNEIIKAISANNIQRNFSILGGEPLSTQNKISYINNLITILKNKYPTIKICLWTGYLYENIIQNKEIKNILNKINYLIDGPFKIQERDITLKWRGSRNQRIIDIQKTLKEGKIVTIN